MHLKFKNEYSLNQAQILSALTRQLKTYNSGVHGDILWDWEGDLKIALDEIESCLYHYGHNALSTEPMTGIIARRLSNLATAVFKQYSK